MLRRSAYLRSALLLLGATALTPIGAAKAQSIEILDSFDGNFSQGMGMSADGSVVVGRSSTGVISYEAFYWTPGTGLVGLGTFGGLGSAAYGVSNDGSTIVGYALTGGGAQRAFRWTQDTGLVSLGTLAGGVHSLATDVSADGRVIVGRANAPGGNNHAFLWLEGGTGGEVGNEQMYDLGVMAGGTSSSAEAVSSAGDVVVGHGNGPGFSAHAFRWTAGTGLVDLGTLTGGTASFGHGVSGNGVVAVGTGNVASGDYHAFAWTEAGGMVDLGGMGGSDAYANDASYDGSVIVGTANDADGNNHAFRWTNASGMVSVADWLEADGVDLHDWEFQTADGVSDDGSVIVGDSEGPEGEYRAYLARVSSLGSGVIDTGAYMASLYDATQIAYAGQHLSWLPLTGAHHRPLMDHADLKGDTCFWASGDFGASAGSGIGLAEVGACQDFGDTVRAGIGAGKSFSTQTLPFGGSNNLDGQYLLGEIDWAPEGTPLLFSGTALVGGWSADIRRGYANGGTTDYSRGTTNVGAALFRGRVDWLDAAAFGTTTLSPWASFTLAHTQVGGYTETGGGFPARFDASSHTSAEIRVGITAETPLSDITLLRTTAEVAHRLDPTGPAVSGQTLGLFAFSLPGQVHSQTWARLGLDLEHQFSPSVLGTLSLHTATAGQDATLSGALGLKVAM